MAAEPKSAEAKAEAKEAKEAKAEAKAAAESKTTELKVAELKIAEPKAELKIAEPKAEIKIIEPKAAEPKPKPVSKRPNAYPSEGFALEIDGKVKSEHDSLETAQERGIALKTKYPVLQVVVYDAATKTRTVLELPG
jgi:hypothetical protein